MHEAKKQRQRKIAERTNLRKHVSSFTVVHVSDKLLIVHYCIN